MSYLKKAIKSNEAIVIHIFRTAKDLESKRLFQISRNNLRKTRPFQNLLIPSLIPDLLDSLHPKIGNLQILIWIQTLWLRHSSNMDEDLCFSSTVLFFCGY